jgi:hypothetical protein
MNALSGLIVSVLAWATAASAAGDDNLLIQLQPDGGYRVWHTEGATQISEEEVLAVAATAAPEGGGAVPVAAGRARAFQTESGVVIEMLDAKTDRKLLVDRDACGAVKLWHSEGPMNLTDDQMTELVLSALPGGGRRLTLDGRHAKAYITPLGYAVVIWKAVSR